MDESSAVGSSRPERYSPLSALDTDVSDQLLPNLYQSSGIVDGELWIADCSVVGCEIDEMVLEQSKDNGVVL